MRQALLGALAATALMVTAAPASAAPTAHHRWESSARFGAWNNGGFIVYNNMWNSSAGPQRIWADAYHYWGVRSTQRAGNTAVETYPCVQRNYNDAPVSSFRGLRNGFTESMPASKAGLDAEAADDVWLNHYKIEVMVWVDNHGQRPAGDVIGHAAIFGQHFTVWHGGSDFTFALGHNERTGVTHMLASINWLIGHHLIPANVTLTQVNFGWEIASTGGHPADFKVSRYWLFTQRR